MGWWPLGAGRDRKSIPELKQPGLGNSLPNPGTTRRAVTMDLAGADWTAAFEGLEALWDTVHIVGPIVLVRPQDANMDWGEDPPALNGDGRGFGAEIGAPGVRG